MTRAVHERQSNRKTALACGVPDTGNHYITFFFFFFASVVVRMEPRALCIRGMHSTRAAHCLMKTKLSLNTQEDNNAFPKD